MWRQTVARIGVVCCLGLAVGCETNAKSSISDSQRIEQATDVSLIQLIAAPDRFEGKRVRIQGFCRLVFEEQSLYLHREDSDLLNTQNAVWLAIPQRPEGLDASFVRVEGTFTGKEHGHLGLWPGSIIEITRLERARTRTDVSR